jgi:acetyltransferase-like isoleucine patch superfamily enzyme
MCWFLRRMGMQVGRGVTISGRFHWPWRRMRNMKLGDGVLLPYGANIFSHADYSLVEIGARTQFSGHLTVIADAPVTVGQDCLFSYDISIISSAHRFGVGLLPRMSGLSKCEPVVIGDRCFVGCYAIILPGVTLGEGCVVGAGAVVTKSFPPRTVLAGNPARAIKTLE